MIVRPKSEPPPPRRVRPVCIVGTGPVGLASALEIAELGWCVNAFDCIPERTERLRRGTPPHREAEIEATLRKHLGNGRVAFFDDLESAARDAQIVIVAVELAVRDDGSTDATLLRLAIEHLSNVLFTTWPTIVIRSTVPPGTSDEIAREVCDWASVVYAPDFADRDRIIVGADQPTIGVGYVMLFEASRRCVAFTSRCNAEMIQYASNAFAALKTSFANEIANVCDALGATSTDVLRGIGYDPRSGVDVLKAGIGFGGQSLEKDLRSLAFFADQRAVGNDLLSATLRVNAAQPHRIVRTLEGELGTLVDRTIGIWGLAFKAGSDDIRESQAMRVIDELGVLGARAVVYDPAVRVAPLPVGSRLASSALEAAHCDALLVLTEWPEFARIDPLDYARHIATGVVVDGRNVLDSGRVAAAGLRYRGIGFSVFPSTEHLHIAMTGVRA